MTNNAVVRTIARPVLAAVAFTVLAAWPSTAHGQSAEELQSATLEELMKITVTTASRHAEDVGDAPANVQVITARQIRTRGYQSLGELLRDQLGIKIELGTDPDYPSEVTFQGSRGTNRVVLLLDGIRVSSPTGEPLPIMSNYPIHNARQVEIVFGPASALYGADAFNGVINVITRDATEAPGLSATVSVGEFGLSNNTATFGQRIGESGSLMISGQWLRDRQADLSEYYPELFNGMQAQRAGLFETIFGAMAPGDVMAQEFQNPIRSHSVSAQLNGGGFQLSFFKNRQRASTSVPYTPDNAVYSSDAFQQNDLWVAAGSFTHQFPAFTSTSTITTSQHTLNPQSGYWNVFSNLHKSFKYAYGSMIKGEQQMSWRPRPRMTVTAGGTFERFFAIPQGADLNVPVVSRRSPGTILGTDIVDEFATMRYSNTGGFVQAQFAVNRIVSLTAGSRGDYNSRYGGTINPRVGAVIKPSRATTLKLLFATAYLAPSPYQSSSHYGSFYTTDGGQTYASDFWHVGNPDLQPQRKTSWQASVTQSIGPLLNLSASAFVDGMDQIIKHDDPDQAGPGTYRGWPVAYIEFPTNEGTGRIYGGTVDSNFLKSWSASRRLQAMVGVSVVDGWSLDDDNVGSLQLGAVAPFQFRSRVDLEVGSWTASAGVMAFGRQRSLAVAADGRSRETLPGFAVADLNVRRNRILRNLDAFVRVDNLFDARYVHVNERAFTNPEELAGSPQGPRRFIAGFDVRFWR